MNINSLQANNASRIAPSSAAVDAAQAPELPVLPEDPAPILGGKSVTITRTSTDIEKLAALLLTQTNKAREDALLGQMQALTNAGVFEKLHSQATASNDRVFTDMETLSKEIDALEKQLPGLEKAVDEAKKTRDAAEKAYEDAVASNAENKDELYTAYLEADTAYKAASKKLSDQKSTIIAKDKELSKLLQSLDVEGFRMLTEALGIDFSELNHTTPLQDETENREKVGNIPLSERSPVSIIREALRQLAGDFQDNLALRREEHV